MTHARHIIPLFLAGLVLILCQIQGAPFWISATGSMGSGWAFSIAWETGSVWLWWRGDRRWWPRAMKWGCTLALVSGMVAESAGPKFAAAMTAAASAWQAAVLAGFVQDGNWYHPRVLGATLDEAVSRAPDLLQGLSALFLLVMLPPFYALGLTAIRMVAAEIGAGAEPPEPKPRRKIPPIPAAPGTPSPRAPATPKPAETVTPERRAINEFADRHDPPLKLRGEVAKAIDVGPTTLSDFANGNARPKQSAAIFAKLREG